jgi:hypothetical protein
MNDLPKGSRMTSAEPNGARHPSPPLLPVAIAHTVLFASSIAISTWMAGASHYPSPFGPAAGSHSYFATQADAVRVGALLVLGSAFPLGIFAATATSRLSFFRIEVAGVSIAAFGGIAASVLLALSGLVSWVLSQPGVAESAATVRALHLLAFATGGPGFVALLGLFVAGISVSGALHKKLPKWLMWFGLVIAVIAELSLLSLVWPALVPLVPAARFPALVWMICTAVLLPKARGVRAPLRPSRDDDRNPIMPIATGGAA